MVAINYWFQKFWTIKWQPPTLPPHWLPFPHPYHCQLILWVCTVTAMPTHFIFLLWGWGRGGGEIWGGGGGWGWMGGTVCVQSGHFTVTLSLPSWHCWTSMAKCFPICQDNVTGCPARIPTVHVCSGTGQIVRKKMIISGWDNLFTTLLVFFNWKELHLWQGKG